MIVINQLLKKLYYEIVEFRLTNFGNISYQKITNDRYFDNVPAALFELWYGNSSLSFRNLGSKYVSDVEQMSNDELIASIYNEFCSIAQLQNIFANFSKQNCEDKY